MIQTIADNKMSEEFYEITKIELTIGILTPSAASALMIEEHDCSFGDHSGQPIFYEEIISPHGVANLASRFICPETAKWLFNKDNDPNVTIPIVNTLGEYGVFEMPKDQIPQDYF
jgi:hypothetical protein